jgi:hypothetical protein
VSRYSNLIDSLCAKQDESIHTLEGLQLLSFIFNELGPYQDGKISPETWEKVKKFFGFDDSE